MSTLNGTATFDYLAGTSEFETIQGFDGNDIIYGQTGDDVIGGDAGKDKLNGGQGNDTIFSGAEDDIVWGAKGNDLIVGGEGNDTLYGNEGRNTLVGGAGSDIFVVVKKQTSSQRLSEADIVSDFSPGLDSIRLINGLTYDDLNIFQGTGNNQGDTIIQDKLTGQYLAVLSGVNSSTLTRDNFVSFTSGKIVADWNKTLLDAVRTGSTPPPVAARNMAIVHCAIYNAVNSIYKTHKSYNSEINAPAGASAEAASAVAAHNVLVGLYPAQKEKFDAVLATSLASIAEGKAKQDGILVGQTAANEMLALRREDGASKTVTYTPKDEAGKWQPTPPAFAASLLPQWPEVTPFCMTNGSQFQPEGPPALESDEYAEELNLVKEIGKRDSQVRTAEQTEIAKFWADGAGTFTPPGHWNQIAQQVSTLADSSLEETARLFALLDMALADAGIVAWDCKYKYELWRPVTAIQKADQDGNADTVADTEWQPLLTTPPFSEYVSGHSTFSGAADAILTAFYGPDFGFGDFGDPGLNQLRTFNSFSEAAEEAGLSRIYGGIHFPSANEDGLMAGRNLGNYVIQDFLT